MYSFSKEKLNDTVFAMLVMFLIASAISAVLGFVVFVHTQFMALFVAFLIVFLGVAIALSFLTK